MKLKVWLDRALCFIGSLLVFFYSCCGNVRTMTAAIDLKASKATEKHTARHNNVGDVLRARARAAVFVSKLQRLPRNKLTVLAL